MLKREVSGRYRGSYLGLFWALLQPVLMLTIYVFVFGAVFKARWGGATDSTGSYALFLFCGLIVFNVFSEVLNRAPSLVLENANYVKKVIFPLELLSVVSLGSSLFHALISSAIWLAFYIATVGVPPLTAFAFPFILLPLALLSLGMSWFFASLGVFLRDVSQFVGLATSALLFLSPIFFPLSAVPPELRYLIELNPLTQIVEQARLVLIYGSLPNLFQWAELLGFSALVAWGGFAWFQKTRKGFADVL